MPSSGGEDGEGGDGAAEEYDEQEEAVFLLAPGPDFCRLLQPSKVHSMRRVPRDQSLSFEVLSRGFGDLKEGWRLC